MGIDMGSVVVIGAQWGDEGKGKIVDFLCRRADWAVRFQGGNNAGHTLVVNGVKTKLNLVPSGILNNDTRCLIAAGVVIDPVVLKDEMEKLRGSGVTVSPERLMLDREAQLILPYHIAIDQAREENKGANKIGTTGRGIGPAFEDRARRSGVRLAELLNLGELKSHLEENVEHANLYLERVLSNSRRVQFDKIWELVEQAASELSPFIGNGSLLLHTALSRGARVVFEGAQGSMLDQTFGALPFVTSSNTISGAVCTGAGIGPRHIGHVLGIAKAYCTRVGEGPFPSELFDSLGEEIRARGGEFGTVTGRPRRCGWFDAVAMRRAVRLSGLDSLGITKLDVLSGINSIKVCTSYRLDGKVLDDMPALASELARVEPEYQELDGWTEDVSQARSLSELPLQARTLLEVISEASGCPIAMVGVGAEREAGFFTERADFLKNFTAEAR